MSKRKIFLLSVVHAIVVIVAITVLVYAETWMVGLLGISPVGGNPLYPLLCSVPVMIAMTADHMIIKRKFPELSGRAFLVMYFIMFIFAVTAFLGFLVYIGSHF